MKRNHYLFSAIGAVLLGCAPIAQGPVVSSCDLSRLNSYIGSQRGALSGLVFTAPMRWIEPDGRISLDYNPGRINVKVDASGLITRIYCG
jgi:hypothetical protein